MQLSVVHDPIHHCRGARRPQRGSQCDIRPVRATDDLGQDTPDCESRGNPCQTGSPPREIRALVRRLRRWTSPLAISDDRAERVPERPLERLLMADGGSLGSEQAMSGSNDRVRRVSRSAHSRVVVHRRVTLPVGELNCSAGRRRRVRHRAEAPGGRRCPAPCLTWPCDPADDSSGQRRRECRAQGDWALASPEPGHGRLRASIEYVEASVRDGSSRKPSPEAGYFRKTLPHHSDIPHRFLTRARVPAPITPAGYFSLPRASRLRHAAFFVASLPVPSHSGHSCTISSPWMGAGT